MVAICFWFAQCKNIQVRIRREDRFLLLSRVSQGKGHQLHILFDLSINILMNLLREVKDITMDQPFIDRAVVPLIELPPL